MPPEFPKPPHNLSWKTSRQRNTATAEFKNPLKHIALHAHFGENSYETVEQWNIRHGTKKRIMKQMLPEQDFLVRRKKSFREKNAIYEILRYENNYTNVFTSTPQTSIFDRTQLLHIPNYSFDAIAQREFIHISLASHKPNERVEIGIAGNVLETSHVRTSYASDGTLREIQVQPTLAKVSEYRIGEPWTESIGHVLRLLDNLPTDSNTFAYKKQTQNALAYDVEFETKKVIERIERMSRLSEQEKERVKKHFIDEKILAVSTFADAITEKITLELSPLYPSIGEKLDQVGFSNELIRKLFLKLYPFYKEDTKQTLELSHVISATAHFVYDKLRFTEPPQTMQKVSLSPQGGNIFRVTLSFGETAYAARYLENNSILFSDHFSEKTKSILLTETGEYFEIKNTPKRLAVACFNGENDNQLWSAIIPHTIDVQTLARIVENGNNNLEDLTKVPLPQIYPHSDY